MAKRRQTSSGPVRAAAQRQRLEQRRRARRRQAASVYGAVLGVLLLTITTAVLVQHATAQKTPTAVPSGAAADTTGGISAADAMAMAIPIGRADAPVKLTVYDDLRCSAYRYLDTTYHAVLTQLIEAGTLQLLIHPVTLIDANLAGTSGSRHAGNAAACAQDAGRFAAYRDLLYGNQPAEDTDA